MRFAHSLLLLCSVVAVVVKGDLATSKTIFTGVDNSDPSAQGADVFRDPRNHAKAAASIIGYSADQANFKPKEHGIQETPQAFDDFQAKASKFPGFLMQANSVRQLNLTGELNNFRDEVIKNYLPEAGKPDVAAAAFAEQIPGSSDGGSLGTRVLVLISIHGTEDNTISVAISSIRVNLSAKGDAIVIDEQYTELRQTIFGLNRGLLTSNADALAGKINTIDINTLLDRLSTNGNTAELLAWLFGSSKGCNMKFPMTSGPRRQRLFSLSHL